MAISPYPIYARDVDALSTPRSPVSVDLKNSTRHDRPLAHGWLANAVVEPGFDVYATRYDSYETYAVNVVEKPSFQIALNLGDEIYIDTPKRKLQLASGNFRAMSLDEPTPFKNHRGERKRQIRCGLWLSSEWMSERKFERFDDSGTIAKTIARRGIFELGAAPAGLLSVASRLITTFNFDGPLAGLRREAAALAFFAEAFSSAEYMQPPPPGSRIEIGRIKRVKEMLDSLPFDDGVRLVDLAVHHGMSVRSLCRHFRQTFGTTILGYVADRRMDIARAALEVDGLTVDQAAYMAGFAHVSNFSSAFRRRFGYRPGRAHGRGYRP